MAGRGVGVLPVPSATTPLKHYTLKCTHLRVCFCLTDLMFVVALYNVFVIQVSHIFTADLLEELSSTETTKSP